MDSACGKVKIRTLSIPDAMRQLSETNSFLSPRGKKRKKADECDAFSSTWDSSGDALAAARKVKMYELPSHNIVPGPNAASSLADRVPTTEVSTKLHHRPHPFNTYPVFARLVHCIVKLLRLVIKVPFPSFATVWPCMRT